MEKPIYTLFASIQHSSSTVSYLLLLDYFKVVKWDGDRTGCTFLTDPSYLFI